MERYHGGSDIDHTGGSHVQMYHGGSDIDYPCYFHVEGYRWGSAIDHTGSSCRNVLWC